MKKEYVVKKINLGVQQIDDIWEEIPSLNIEYYPWDINNYKPTVEIKMFYTDTHFHLYFKADESKIKAKYEEMNEPVYRDSCVEFFFKPKPQEDERYFNFEINPLGTLLLGLGTGRDNRKYITEIDPDIFEIKSSENKETIKYGKRDFWTIQYSIPYTFIEEFFGKVNYKYQMSLKANFYKCGDDFEYPHYGCWNLIEHETPDFHQPEYFGDLVLDK